YKMARNKRLHVEMAMIKLTFLQQAIELSFNNQSDSLVKKKRVSGPVAVKFEQIQSFQIKTSPSATSAIPSAEAKLYIEREVPSPVSVAEPVNAIVTKLSIAKVSGAQTQTDIATLNEPAVKQFPIKPVDAASGKKSLLQSLRDKHLANKSSQQLEETVPVTEENLKEHWKCFTEKLKQQLKYSVVTVFNNAGLKVVNEQHFSVTVSASLEQKFIEQEKLPLLEYLKDCFQNRNIGFTIYINDQPKEIVFSEATLTTREKYQKMIEQYPMIKELKDRLRLELDY
ncbi:MAG: DNA polymerase III subunit gamma/tau, partial [Segetibacter sp.]